MVINKEFISKPELPYLTIMKMKNREAADVRNLKISWTVCVLSFISFTIASDISDMDFEELVWNWKE